jgi:hypothetical protein
MVDKKIDKLALTIMEQSEFYTLLSRSQIEIFARRVGCYDYWVRAQRVTNSYRKELEFANFLKILYTEQRGLFEQFLGKILREYLEHSLHSTEIPEPVLICLHSLGYDFDQGKLVSRVGKIEAEQEIETQLDEWLQQLNSNFPSIRRAAWETYLSGNPDRLRQSITSMRELLNNVIKHLAPDETLHGRGIKKVERAHRLKHILGDSTEAEVVDAIVRVINSLYSVASKATHSPKYESEATLYTLKSIEYTLYFLLAIHKASKG